MWEANLKDFNAFGLNDVDEVTMFPGLEAEGKVERESFDSRKDPEEPERSDYG